MLKVYKIRFSSRHPVVDLMMISILAPGTVSPNRETTPLSTDVQPGMTDEALW